ncbi:MAG: translocation/assembly module TamB domain-containing protein [Pseudomonadota bacterium]
MKRHRTLRWSASIALVLMLAFVATTTVVLTTSWGARAVVQLAVRYAPVLIDVERIEGSLLGGLTLYGVSIASADADIQVQQVALQVARSTLFKPTDIVIDLLAIDTVRIQQDSARNAQNDAMPFFSVPALPVLSLPVALRIKQLSVTSVQTQSAADARTVLDRMITSVAIDGDQLVLDRLEVTLPDAYVAGDVRMRFATTTSVDARLGWRLPNATGTPQGALTVVGPRDALRITHVLEQPVRAETEGVIALPVNASVDAQLVTHVDTVTFPLQGMDSTLENVIVRVEGAPDAWQLAASGVAGAPEQPDVPVELEAGGSLQSASVSSLRVGTAATGIAVASGNVRWSPRLAGEARVQVDDFALTTLTGVDATLSGILSARSEDVQAGVFSVELDALRGKVLGHAIAGDGSLQRRSAQDYRGALSVSAGSDTLRIVATPDQETASLRAEFVVNALSDYQQRAQGAISGTLTVSGDATDPRVAARITGKQLQLDDGAQIDALTLSVDGSAAAHRIELAVEANAVGTLTAQGAGTLRDGEWMGRAQSIVAQSNRLWSGSAASALTLAAPASLRVSRTAIAVESVCFDLLAADQQVLQTSALCVAADVSAQAAEVALKMSAIPVDYDINAALNVAGAVSLNSTITGPLDALDVQLNLAANDARITAPTEDGQQTVQIETFALDASVAGGRLQVQPHIAVAERARLTGLVVVDQCCAQTATAVVSGRVELSMQDLAFANALQNAVQFDAGSARLTMEPGGSLAQPTLRVDGTLSAADFAVFATGVRYADAAFSVHSDSAGLITWDGQAGTEDGRITFDGQVAQPLRSSREILAQVTLQNAQLLDLPDMTARANAQIDIQWSADALSMSGDAALTHARIALQELPRDSVAVSPDIRQAGTAQEDTSTVRLDLAIDLGDDAQLQGFGLNAGIAGALDLRKRVNTPLSGYGELRTRDATYQAYGQTLQVTRGRLRFDGPLTQPALTIRAERTIDEQSVGVDITGYPGDLRSTLFAAPNLPDADTLSLLLTGRQLASASASEGNALADAAITLGLRQASGVTGAIRDAVGLDTLTVAGNGRDGRLLAGKQISNDIYLQYAYGVFDQLSSVLLRWQLNKRLALESRSGDTQSLDLIYQVGNPRQ